MWEEYKRQTGLVVVLSGPSGVGKDSVLIEFLRIHPTAAKCVTSSTRSMRPGEVNGCDYNFISVDEFRGMIDTGGFLEWAEVHGNYYGTPKDWVVENARAGRDVILKIDVQGGLAVKEQIPEAVMVFLAPPSLEELERRLRSRLTETEADIIKRLNNAKSELQHISDYEYLVENDTVEHAAEELKAIIIAERARIQR